MISYKQALAASELGEWRQQTTKAQLARAAYRQWEHDRAMGLVAAGHATEGCVGGCDWRDWSN